MYSPVSSAAALSAAALSAAAISASALSAANLSAALSAALSASSSSARRESWAFANASMPPLEEGRVGDLDASPVLTPKIWL